MSQIETQVVKPESHFEVLQQLRIEKLTACSSSLPRCRDNSLVMKTETMVLSACLGAITKFEEFSEVDLMEQSLW